MQYDGIKKFKHFVQEPKKCHANLVKILRTLNKNLNKMDNKMQIWFGWNVS